MKGGRVFQSAKNTPNTAKTVKKTEHARDAAVTILTSGCHFSGKLFCRGSTRIGGTIEGEVQSEGLLIVEEGAKINANVKADEVVIQGVVEGRLEAGSRVELCASSVFIGDIVTPCLVVKEGAQFDGRATMAGAAKKSKNDNTQRSADSYQKKKDHEPSVKEAAFSALPEASPT